MLIEHFDVPYFDVFLKKEVTYVKGEGATRVEKTEKEYQKVPNKLPTLEDFAYDIGVDVDCMVNWAKAKDKRGRLKHPRFFGAYTRAKQLQKQFLINNGLAGLTPPSSFIFVAKNITDMDDKQGIDITSKGKRITGFNYVSPVVQLGDGRNSSDNSTNA
jgi:hypothetical protein